MKFCPVCKSELSDDADECMVCNYDINNNGSKWKMIGSITDNISSGYAKETLKSYNIPVVIISNSGFFGTAGLALNPFHGSDTGLFDVSVPEEFVEEAAEILSMILSDSWIKKD